MVWFGLEGARTRAFQVGFGLGGIRTCWGRVAGALIRQVGFGLGGIRTCWGLVARGANPAVTRDLCGGGCRRRYNSTQIPRLHGGYSPHSCTPSKGDTLVTRKYWQPWKISAKITNIFEIFIYKNT